MARLVIGTDKIGVSRPFLWIFIRVSDPRAGRAEGSEITPPTAFDTVAAEAEMEPVTI